MSVPQRNEIPPKDCWNLEKLFPSDQDWNSSLKTFIMDYNLLPPYEKTMTASAKNLREALDAYMECDMRAEQLGYYAMLRLQEDLSNHETNEQYAKFLQVQADYARVISFFRPKIQEINDQDLQLWCQSEILSPYRSYLEHLIRFKPHTLSTQQEALIAPLGEIFNTPDHAFSALTDVDMQFGTVKIDNTEVTITQANFSSLLKKSDPDLRKTVYSQFYHNYDQHKHVLAALYAGSIRQDLYNARIRHFPDARTAALFPDNVPAKVYDNLIKTVRANLPILHHYYELRCKLLGMNKLRHCDVYAPLFPAGQTHYSYEQGVDVICEALAPLGQEYCQKMHDGLLGHWVDRYENKGKSSGAFSAGSYLGEPYILMNYKADNLRTLFTLAHEAGHSMHSLYSVENNPYQDHQYSIFEAETASTFNESLLFHYLFNKTDNILLKKSLISERIDDILATLFRQTMFAEFELRVHQSAAEGHPPTLDFFRKTYRELLNDYFGSQVELFDVSDLEGLRIPHFYRSFYVYKYATGIAASLALSERILHGKEEERQKYMMFLKSGGQHFPIENLRLAGVDMAEPAPIEAAINYFKTLVNKLEDIITG